MLQANIVADYLMACSVKMHQMQSKSQFNEHNNAFSVLQELLHSPDLNPIAHLWNVQEQEIHCMNMQPTNLQELCHAFFVAG